MPSRVQFEIDDFVILGSIEYENDNKKYWWRAFYVGQSGLTEVDCPDFGAYDYKVEQIQQHLRILQTQLVNERCV